ncbi:hypothetical protein AYR62_14255 [Secundilactobacillus paracollinoides]|uniref:HTH marR-type domain-containing protein n=1 Tax=Secundilactobacillus paracollinoides TaxID=240427 RepID=A0A1B2IX42_9LACO|nr:MarR family transcriptional regulator [Secundilactobacillus paracollinoides]ANZ60757.1 hypothetical protein AYR61_04960 [Secundilactobacillus paracollinoides]ANZ65129.1 hypothetical protein AYR62_14255 [Secundilactobacillus paracollinoides]ANZ66601.1 hypothetical protein AYR63_05250 [Secundilactobacillus paracollinoides]
MANNDQNNIVSLDIMMMEFQRAYLFQRKFIRAYANAPKAKYDITFDEYLIMHDIAMATTDMASSDLAERHQVSKPAMTRLLKGLVAKQLIIETEGTDKRQKIWQLTPKGQEVDRAVTADERVNVKTWQDRVGTRRIQEFFSFLDEFQDAISDTHGYFPVEGGSITKSKEQHTDD